MRTVAASLVADASVLPAPPPVAHTPSGVKAPRAKPVQPVRVMAHWFASLPGKVMRVASGAPSRIAQRPSASGTSQADAR